MTALFISCLRHPYSATSQCIDDLQPLRAQCRQQADSERKHHDGDETCAPDAIVDADRKLPRTGYDETEHRRQAHVFGYGVGLDLTRRDLQSAAKAKGLPWDTAKAFDRSAPVSALRRATESGHPQHAQLSLEVNGAVRQSTDIGQMIFSVADIIHELSKLFELHAGDLIFTGTPAGVAALQRGDRFHARLEGIAELRGAIT